MNMEITRETKILAEVQRQQMPEKRWMLGAIAELGNAPNWQSVSPEHVASLLREYPDRKSFEEAAERYVNHHVYGFKPDSDPVAFAARKEAAESCIKLGKIIYG